MWCKQYEQEMQGPFPTDAATMRRTPPTNVQVQRSVTAIYFCGGWVGESHSGQCAGAVTPDVISGMSDGEND